MLVHACTLCGTGVLSSARVHVLRACICVCVYVCVGMFVRACRHVCVMHAGVTV